MPLIVMTPLRAGHEDALLDALAQTPGDHRSPFARIAGTHLVRLLLVPALLGPSGEPLAPERSFLLFSAELDDDVDVWSSAACSRIGAELDRIWGHCSGYPGAADAAAFARYLDEHRVRAGFSLRAYDASLEEVRSALELRDRLRDFARETQGASPHELRVAWHDRLEGHER